MRRTGKLVLGLAAAGLAAGALPATGSAAGATRIAAGSARSAAPTSTKRRATAFPKWPRARGTR